MKYEKFLSWPLCLIPLSGALAVGLLFYLSAYSEFSGPQDDNLRWIFAGIGFLFFVLTAWRPIKEIIDKSSPWVQKSIWIVTFGLLLYGPTEYALNILLDRSSEHEVVVLVDQKYERHGKHTSYYLSMLDSEIGPGRQTIMVHTNFYDGMKIGDHVALKIHSGFFGKPWFTGWWEKRRASADAT